MCFKLAICNSCCDKISERCACDINCCRGGCGVNCCGSDNSVDRTRRQSDADKAAQVIMAGVDALVKAHDRVGKLHNRRLTDMTGIDEYKPSGLEELFLDQLGLERLGEQEAKARLLLCSFLAGIPLQERVARNAPISVAEYNQLVKAVTQITRYGSKAVILWKIVHAYSGDIKALAAIGVLRDRQVELLGKLIKDKGVTAYQQHAFQELGDDVKSVYLDAAANCYREFEVQYFNSFVSFLGEDMVDDSLSMHSHDLSYDSPVEDGSRETGRRPTTAQARMTSVFEKFGDVHPGMEEDDRRRHLSLGIVRAQLLADLIGMKPDQIKYGSCSVEEEQKLRDGYEKLIKLDGAIVHLFHALKATIDVDALKKDHKLTELLIQNLKKWTKSCPEFFYYIQKAREVSAMPLHLLIVLARLAETLPQRLRDECKQTSADWLSNPSEPSTPDERYRFTAADLESGTMQTRERRSPSIAEISSGDRSEGSGQGGAVEQLSARPSEYTLNELRAKVEEDDE